MIDVEEVAEATILNLSKGQQGFPSFWPHLTKHQFFVQASYIQVIFYFLLLEWLVGNDDVCLYIMSSENESSHFQTKS